MSDFDDDINEASENAKKAGRTAKGKMDDVTSEAKSKWDEGVKKAKSFTKQAVDDYEDETSSSLKNIKDKASNYVQQSESLVEKYPLYALLGAAAIGLLAGIVIAHKSEN